MNSLQLQGNTLKVRQLFNEQQAAGEFQNLLKTGAKFNHISFDNVGIKIMKEALRIFEQQQIQHVTINYDWNQIMVMPKLVCYDKNTWKTLQQLANWNKQWNELFNGCLALRNVDAHLTISWMDDQWVKSFLQGLTSLPNVTNVSIHARSKDPAVQKMLTAFTSAKIFACFVQNFQTM